MESGQLSFKKAQDKGMKRGNYCEQLTCSSFWPFTHRQHSHLQLVWRYLCNASGGLRQGWQGQVRILEPVLQNSELVSKSVCKELGTFFWVLAVDCFSHSPRAVVSTSTLELSVPVRNTKIPKFHKFEEPHTTVVHINPSFFNPLLKAFPI